MIPRSSVILYISVISHSFKINIHSPLISIQYQLFSTFFLSFIFLVSFFVYFYGKSNKIAVFWMHVIQLKKNIFMGIVLYLEQNFSGFYNTTSGRWASTSGAKGVARMNWDPVVESKKRRAAINCLQNATLVAFSPSGRENDAMRELGHCLIESLLNKITSPSLLIAAVYV